jgi:hypothetical protein
MISLLVGSGIADVSPCQVIYLPGPDMLNLVNSGGTALMSASGVKTGTHERLDNGRCSLDVSSASRVLQGTSVTLSVTIDLYATFKGSRKVYGVGFSGDQVTHWFDGASLNVP